MYKIKFSVILLPIINNKVKDTKRQLLFRGVGGGLYLESKTTIYTSEPEAIKLLEQKRAIQRYSINEYIWK